MNLLPVKHGSFPFYLYENKSNVKDMKWLASREEKGNLFPFSPFLFWG